jgi:hypothetical protein
MTDLSSEQVKALIREELKKLGAELRIEMARSQVRALVPRPRVVSWWSRAMRLVFGLPGRLYRQAVARRRSRMTEEELDELDRPWLNKVMERIRTSGRRATGDTPFRGHSLGMTSSNEVPDCDFVREILGTNTQAPKGLS